MFVNQLFMRGEISQEVRISFGNIDIKSAFTAFCKRLYTFAHLLCLKVNFTKKRKLFLEG